MGALMRGAFRIFFTSVFLVGLPLQAQEVFAQNPVQKWQRVEADNGSAFALDLNSLARFSDGGVLIIVCNLDNDICPIQNQSRFKFDCRGHYIDVDRRGPLQSAPPRSVAGKMAEIVCSSPNSSQPSSAPPSVDQTVAMAARKALGLCFVAEAQSAPYSEERPKLIDRAIMQTLLYRCKSQHEKWQAQCVADGRAEIWCAATAYAMIGWASDLLGR